MFFSLIIPVHNLQSHIGRCLRSIIEQSFKDYEVILVENGSTDNSYEICSEYVSDKIMLLRENCSGVSRARNLGMTKALGRYIWFIDGDDLILPGSLACLYEKITSWKFPDVLIFRNTVEKNNIIRTAGGVFTEQKLSRQTALTGLFNASQWSGFVWSKCYRADIVKKIAFDTDIHMIEDLEFNVRVFLKANDFLYLDNILYQYSIRNDSCCARFSEKKLTSFVAYEKIEKALCNIEYQKVRKKANSVLGNAKVDFSRYLLEYYYATDRSYYRKKKKQYQKIIWNNMKYVRRLSAFIATFFTVISPRLIIWTRRNQR